MLDSYKYGTHGDEELDLPQKLKLIEGIEYWQQERWERLKRWHKYPNLIQPIRHMFMQKEIDLMRREKQRLLRLKQETAN